MKKQIEITVNGKPVIVKKLALGKYGALLQALDNLPPEVAQEISNLDKASTEQFLAKLPALLGKAWDSIVKMLSIATDLEAEYLTNECDLVDGANLLKAVFEVNDFLAVKNALSAAFQPKVKEAQADQETGSGK